MIFRTTADSPNRLVSRAVLPRLNSTISIFGALLLFHTFEDVLEHYILPAPRPHAWVAGHKWVFRCN
jgi:hypothetical protein